MNKREIGTEAENIVASYLAAQGMEILERNYRCRQGEIDIIGRHEGYLVFVEVKYRTSESKGSPEASVGTAKQRTICRVADYYRCTRGIRQSVPIRYDVVAMQGEVPKQAQIRWHRNAFAHWYR